MSEVDLGRLGYGAANVGNLYREVSDEVAWAALEAAWDSGIRYFDTAPHYGLGLSERRLGAFLQTKPRDEYVISTKVGRLLRPNPDGAGTTDLAHDFAVPGDLRRVWDFTVDGIRRSLDESLQRLGLDAVDILFLHDPGGVRPDVGAGEPGCRRWPSCGPRGGSGLPASDPSPPRPCSRRSGPAQLDLLMVAGRYTLLDQPAALEVLPECRSRGVGVVAAAVFNSGVLARPVPTVGDRYEYGAIPDDLLARVRRIAEVCAAVRRRTAHGGHPVRAARARRCSASSSVVVGRTRCGRTPSGWPLRLPDELWRALEDNELVTI